MGGKMDPKHSDLLNKYRPELIAQMNPKVIIDHLLSTGTLLDQDEVDIVKNEETSDQNRALLRILKDRGNQAFGNFINALNMTRQQTLAELLQQPSGSEKNTALLESLKRLSQEQYKNALTRSLVYICEHLNNNEVLNYMENAQVIRKVSVDVIRSKLAYDANRELVDHLRRSDKNAFVEFIKALLHTAQVDVVQRIADASPV